MMNKITYILIAVSISLNLILGTRLYFLSKTLNQVNSSLVKDISNATTEDIYFIGNSIIKPAKLDILLNNKYIVNKAISGMTTTDAVMMSNQLIPTKPQKVFIMLGINDIKTQTPINITIRNIGHFVYTIKRYSPSTKIYLLSVLPVNENINKYDIENNKIKQLNLIINDFCNRFNFKYIDLFNVLLDDNSNLDKKFTMDGLHINEPAYFELAKHLKTYIENKS